MPETIQIHEVGPRDGLQNEPVLLPTPEKLALIGALVAAGLRRIEVTSFVSPRAVPQLADAARVAQGVRSWPGVRTSALVLTEGGYARALAAGCTAVAVVVVATESLSRANSRTDVGGALEICRRVLRRARRDGVWTRVYLSAAWVCPYEGPVPPERVLALAEVIRAEAPDELALADSVGCARPLEVGRLVEAAAKRTGLERLAVHLHDTQGFGLANAEAALSAGARILDGSVGGLGGCPFAPGAAGNLATEALVRLAHVLGFATGVSAEALGKVARDLKELLGSRNPVPHGGPS